MEFFTSDFAIWTYKEYIVICPLKIEKCKNTIQG